MRYSIKPDDFSKLKRNNLLFGVLYLLFGAFIFIGSFTIQAVKNFTPDLYLNYIERVRVTTYPLRYQLQNKIMEIVSNIPFMLIVGVVLIISAIIHIVIITNKVNPEYNNNLQSGVNKLRAVEGGLNSVLLALLPILIGVNDISILALLFTLGIVFNLLALSMEQANAKAEKTIWTPFVGMVLSFVVGGGILVLAILKQLNIQQALLDNATITVPYLKSFNFIVIILYFGFWFLKLIHIFLQHKKVGRWKNPLFIETVYITLNFLAKISITAVVFYGLVNSLFTEFYKNLL